MILVLTFIIILIATSQKHCAFTTTTYVSGNLGLSSTSTQVSYRAWVKNLKRPPAKIYADLFSPLFANSAAVSDIPKGASELLRKPFWNARFFASPDIYVNTNQANKTWDQTWVIINCRPSSKNVQKLWSFFNKCGALYFEVGVSSELPCKTVRLDIKAADLKLGSTFSWFLFAVSCAVFGRSLLRLAQIHNWKLSS